MRAAWGILALLGTVIVPSLAMADTLERVVLVSRHGVRPPTRSNDDLAQYSDRAWPVWPVAPGELTPHGATALERMGEGLALRYGALLGGCEVYVWSDGDDNRTRDSGAAFAKGLAPHCPGKAGHGTPGEPDVLFDAVDAGLCPVDPKRAEASIRERLDAMLAKNGALYARSRARMQSILTAGCGKDRVCHVGEGENQIKISRGEAKLEGPLNIGSSLSENLLLEYAQGMPLDQVGFGRMGATEAAQKAALTDVLALHNLYSDVTRRNPYLASRRSTPMMQTILDALDGKQSQYKGAIPLPQSKVLVFLGHDGNLANLSGLLDTAWTLPGQPDATAPDTVVAFEAWRGKDGVRVKVKLFYQTLDQVRGLTRFTSATPVPSLTLPVCSGKNCSLAAFREKLAPKLSPDCLTPAP